METLTRKQRDEILEIFGDIYKDAKRHRDCRQLSYWSATVENVLKKGRELLRTTYDGIFWGSAVFYIQQHGRELNLENVQFALALTYAIWNKKNA